MENMLTIVIPVYNRAKLVERTLQSIERQSFRPLSVILVDNNSTDETTAVLNEWRDRVAAPDFHVTVTSEPTPGAPAARNKGLQLVTTPYTMFFDSDDEMLPNHVADFEQAIREHPDVKILGRNAIFRSLDGKTRILRFTSTAPFYNHIFHGSLATQRFVVHTRLVKDVGGWDNSVKVWNDYELGIRLLLATSSIMTLPGRPSVVIHATGDSITGTSYWTADHRRENSLNHCEALLLKAGKRRCVNWINVRRVILAAKYHLEGHTDDARRLMQSILNNSHGKFRLRLLYWQHILCKRGTAIPAAILF